MGATLRYAKVVDREHLQAHGGLSPATDNLVKLVGTAPAVARDFLILRAWDDVGSGFEEQWHLEDAHGRVVYRGTPRTVLAEHGDIFDELVQEISTGNGGSPDLGPRYRIKARP